MEKRTNMRRTVSLAKRELGNVVEVVKASKENIRPSRMVLNTWEDVQAVLTSTSGIVAGLKWKKTIIKMMDYVYGDDKVLSVCPIKEYNKGMELLLMVTENEILISNGNYMDCIRYEKIIYLGKKQGVVSDYIVIKTDLFTIEFTWDNKKGDLKLAYYTRKILFSKVRRITTTRQLEASF